MEERRHTATETVRRGKEIYEESIRQDVEGVHDGRFLVVDVTTGAYEVADDELSAFDRAQERNPDGVFYLLRVGRSAAHRIGGRIFANPA